MKSKQSGFTLVEIAIVLVIVGLLLGGVLKGQELITSSKAKSISADKNTILTAFNMYQDRSKALPGDDAQAGVLTVAFNGLPIGTAGRFTAAPCGGAECINGGGNGAYTGGWNAALPAAGLTAAANGGNNAETNKIWQHLRAAGFIKFEGNIFASPTNASSGLIGIQNANLYVGAPAATVQFVTGGVPTNIAQALDASNDDGFMNAGGWRAALNTAANANAGGTYGTINAAGAVQAFANAVHVLQTALY